MSTNNEGPRLFWRDSGPVCFETHLFFPAGKRQLRAKEMVDSDLSWHWTSDYRTEETRPSEPGPPRPLTRLTAQTLTGFLDDSAERDADGYGRSIVLLGFAAASAKAFDSLRDHIARFVRGSRDGPDLVIVQTGDSAEYVFTPHEPSPEAKRLLSTWGLVPSGTQRVPYKRLGVAKLEAIFDIR